MLACEAMLSVSSMAAASIRIKYLEKETLSTHLSYQYSSPGLYQNVLGRAARSAVHSYHVQSYHGLRLSRNVNSHLAILIPVKARQSPITPSIPNMIRTYRGE